MRKDKGIIWKYAPTALVLEGIGVALILLVLFLTATLYPDAPNSVPRHFTAGGVIAEWGEKRLALLWPIAAVYVYLILTGVGLLVRRMPADGKTKDRLSMVLMLILCVKIVFLLFVLAGAYATMLAQDLPLWAAFILPVGIGITVIVGITMIRNNNGCLLAVKEAKV